MTTGEIVAAVIGPISFGLFLFFFNRIHNRKPRIVEVPVEVEKKVYVPIVVGVTDGPLPPSLQEADIMAATGASKINVDVKNCPRCGKDHEDLEFDSFTEKSIAGFTHHGTCPETSDPILVKIGITDDSELTAPKTCATSGGCSKRAGE